MAPPRGPRSEADAVVNDVALNVRLAMSTGREVVLDLRTRPARHVQGRVRRCSISKAKRIDPKNAEGRSNLVIEMEDGFTVDLERVKLARLVS